MKAVKVSLIGILIFLSGCGVTTQGSTSDLYREISNQLIAGGRLVTVEDINTGCQYMIAGGQGAIPLNDASGKPQLGCKGVSK
jgi:hypothetical protein